MVVHRRKKVVRQRGSRTHGWGLVHRGSGQRGGSGKGGIKAKQPQLGKWLTQQMGKHGFVRHGRRAEDTTINLRDLEQQAPALIAAKQAKEQAGIITVDLGAIGYTKLLSTGKALRKWNITVKKAVPDAVEKVKATGGTVTAQ